MRGVSILRMPCRIRACPDGRGAHVWGGHVGHSPGRSGATGCGRTPLRQPDVGRVKGSITESRSKNNFPCSPECIPNHCTSSGSLSSLLSPLSSPFPSHSSLLFPLSSPFLTPLSSSLTSRRSSLLSPLPSLLAVPHSSLLFPHFSPFPSLLAVPHLRRRKICASLFLIPILMQRPVP